MITLVRRQGDAVNLKPGEYTQVYTGELYSESTWCHMKCPSCGHGTRIAKAYHYVNYLGVLSPKVACPHKCGFTDWVVLDEWLPEAKGKA